jgi:hypothetical protein
LDDDEIKNEEKRAHNEETLTLLRNELQSMKQNPSRTGGILQQSRSVTVLIHLPERRTTTTIGQNEMKGNEREGKREEKNEREDQITLNLTLTYVVSKATWSPSYDLRLNTQQNVMDLSYYAEVTQSCGEDWKDCNICLSTSNPAIGSSPPSLPTRTVDWDYNCERGGGGGGRSGGGGSKNKKKSLGNVSSSRYRSNEGSDEEENYEARRGSFALMEEERGYGGGEGGPTPIPPPGGGASASSSKGLAVNGNDSGSTTFIIPRKVTIESDNKPHKVTVAVASFTPQLVHYVAASISAFVYLQSKTQNTSPYPLLASEKVLVFLDGNFVTSTSINQTSPGEHFNIFLGVDPSVKVQYMPCKTVQYLKGWLSGTEVKKYFYSTVIQNTKQRPIRVIVAEVLPRAADEKITVELLEPSPGSLMKPTSSEGTSGGPIVNEQDVIAGLDGFDGAGGGTEVATGGRPPGSWPRDFVTQNKFTNNLVWLKTLQPGEKTEIKFAYRVAWPQGQSVGVR